MRIVVFIGGITHSSQKNVFDGIWDKAKEAGVDLYVFSCSMLNNFDGKKEHEGAWKLYDLPDFKDFDGAITMYETIFYENPETAKKVIKAIADSGIPAVNVGNKVEGFATVSMDNYNSVYAATEYLIKNCGKKEIYLLSGKQKTKDILERNKGYFDAMAKYRLEVKPYMVRYGNFSPKEGRDALEGWIDREGHFPEAVVCVNDVMAIGVMEHAQKGGLKVPEDIMVTGLDNTLEAKMSVPRLSSVERGSRQAGYKALELIITERDNKEFENIEIKQEFKFIASESCGVKDDTDFDIIDMKRGLMYSRSRNEMLIDAMKSIIASASVIDNPIEFIEMLKTYVERTESDYFYLCLNDIDITFNNYKEENDSDYTELMHTTIIYEKGKNKEMQDFKKRELLPKDIYVDENSNCYMFLPLGYEKLAFGYCVFNNSRFPIDDYFCSAWVMSIGTALNNIRQKAQLNNMIGRLNRVWLYDSLTGLYNRAGFFRLAKPLVDGYINRGMDYYVLFMDLDGLKKINDTLGHESGDRYIKAMADVINAAVSENEISVRYGGDEFVILGPEKTGEGRGQKLRDKIHLIIAEYNEHSNDFELSVSIGLHNVFHTHGNEPLEQILDKADRDMYEQKKRKKEA